MLVFWDVTSCSLATVTGMLQACSAFVCKFKLFKGRCTVSASSEPTAQWHRVVPQTNGKIQVGGFAMTCTPCPHKYITGPLFWANPFYKNHFNIILPSSELSNQSLALASVQNPNLLRVSEGSVHSTSFLFPWPRIWIRFHTFNRFRPLSVATY